MKKENVVAREFIKGGKCLIIMYSFWQDEGVDINMFPCDMYIVLKKKALGKQQYLKERKKLIQFFEMSWSTQLYSPFPSVLISFGGCYLTLSRSLPALEVLAESSLMLILIWNLETNMLKMICSSSNGKIFWFENFLVFQMKLFSCMLTKFT